MRLWHQKLIPYLPRQQLLGQHRECCALRGKGWGKKHATVDYVFTHSPDYLIAYHFLVMHEMRKRGYNPDEAWDNPNYRGNILGIEQDRSSPKHLCSILTSTTISNEEIYFEHDDAYLRECIENLENKGVDMSAAKEALYG